MLQDAISKMDPTVSSRASGPPTSQAEWPGPSVLHPEGSPGLLGGVREVRSLFGWHMRQPGFHVTCSYLLSTYCVPGI